ATNVTISGNTAGESGGAIRVKTTGLVIDSATIADNHATLGAGAIHADDIDAARLKSSILASNTSGAGASLNVSNLAQKSMGHNLATQATAWLSHPQDIISTSVALRLEALAANGGFAPTHALLLGSTAIDKGSSSAPTDQRGVTRVGTPDIGAYEYNLGNAAPTISAIADQTTDEDTTLGPLAFTIGDLESGPGGLTVTATSLNTGLLPQAGIVLGGSGANRTITLTPAANANSVLNGGSVTVRISVSDGVNTTLRDFLLTVNPVADDPVALDDLASTPSATTVVVAVLGNDDDMDGDSIVIHSASLQDGSQGSLGFDNTTITFTPGPAVTGAVLINYTVRDSTGRISNTAVLTVNVGANNAPTAASGMVALNEDTSRAIVLANLGYGDPDGHAFAALRVDSLPSAGSLWFNGELVTSAGLIVNAADLAAGKLVFTPATNANGATYATLQFSVQDSVGAFSAASATLTFNVVAQPDAPIAVDDVASTPINQPIDVNVLANDSHPDGVAVSYAVTGVVLDDPSQGTVSISYALDARGSVLFTPASNVSGEIVIRYTVTDDAATPASSMGTLRVTVGANTAPNSAPTTVTVAEDGSYTVQAADIAYADPDAGQSFAALRIDQLPQFGMLTIAGVAAQVGDSITAARLAAGDLVYRPQADGNGPGFDQFLFSVVDSADARSGSFGLTLDVTPVNDAPVASGSAVLPGVTEDALAPGGATVASLFGGNFSDTRDAGNPGQNQLAGVAVVGQSLVPAQGRWQYSIDGGLLWNDFGGTLSDSAA
ncbi:MAG: tandem-95 repeat protein, partial [Rhodoferax sp.]|nr:tandem-95 repeat protein [Rhodoferax sp.]